MIAAVFQHIYLLFVFRHSGAGLPSRGPAPYVLLGIAASTTAIRGALEMGDPLLAVIGIGIVVAITRSRPGLIAPIALVCIGGDSLGTCLVLLSLHSLSIIVLLWQVTALIVFVRQATARGF